MSEKKIDSKNNDGSIVLRIVGYVIRQILFIVFFITTLPVTLMFPDFKFRLALIAMDFKQEGDEIERIVKDKASEIKKENKALAKEIADKKIEASQEPAKDSVPKNPWI